MNNNQFVQSIKIPTNVHVFLDRNKLLFFGPLGINTFSFPSYSSVDNQPDKKLKNFPAGFQLKFEANNTQNEIILQNIENSKQIQTHGNTLISLLNRKLLGVVQGFFVSLEIQGIGYRVILSDTSDFSDSIRKTEQRHRKRSRKMHHRRKPTIQIHLEP